LLPPEEAIYAKLRHDMFRVVCQRDCYLCTLAAVKNVRTIVQLEFMLDSATTKQNFKYSHACKVAVMR